MTGAEPLLSPDGLHQASNLLAELDADGWLLYDFGGQNPLAHRLLGAGKTTRPAFALIPRVGEPVLIRHAIESSAWRAWPWEVRPYAGWRQMRSTLDGLLVGVGVVAMETSEFGAVPTVDRVPSGIVDLVRASGVAVISSADLITAFHARWSPLALERHRAASESLRTIALSAFERAAEAATADIPLTEGKLIEWIRLRMREEGITDQEDCIVAGGSRTADPHYQPLGDGAPLERESVVLIDLWGSGRGGVPADQTWMGFLGRTAPEPLMAVWEAVVAARDAALTFLAERWATGAPIRGWEVDAAARRLLVERGFGEHFLHRLGHSIDAEVHGSGPNLDDLETHDERRLLPGIGFSVEPGVYLPGEFGARSEVNVYLGDGGPEVTPLEIQRELLLAPTLSTAS